MKKTILLLTFSGLLIFSTTTTATAATIVYSNGETLTTVQKLPAEYCWDDGEHFNLGVKHSQFSIFWIPIWNYGNHEYVLVNDAKDTYDNSNMAEVIDTLRDDGYKIPEKPILNFWNRIGGKIVGTLVVLLVLFGASWFTGLKNLFSKGE